MKQFIFGIHLPFAVSFSVEDSINCLCGAAEPKNVIIVIVKFYKLQTLAALAVLAVYDIWLQLQCSTIIVIVE